jgi:hypothetical protein
VPSHTATVVIQPDAIRWLAQDGTVLSEHVFNEQMAQGVVLSTGKHDGFAPPTVHAIEDVAPTGERVLAVTAPHGEITARFSFERLSLVRASDGGRFIVTHGSPAPQGLPPGGPAPFQGQYIVYDASGHRVVAQGGSGDARYFQDIHDGGWMLDVGDVPGRASRTVRLLRVDGTPMFERSFEATRWDAANAFFSPEGDFIILQVAGTASSPLGFSVTVWDRSGAERFRFASALPGEVRRAGTSHLLVHEILERTRHRFHLVELPASGAGRTLGRFDVEEAVQQFWGRLSPDANRLIFVVHYRDRRGNQQWRLQSRDVMGQRRSERRLDPPDSMLADAMLRSYGDGLHWIVADGKKVRLLVP